MSNHICATQVKTILLQYSNGVQTLVPCNKADVNYVLMKIKEAIQEFKEENKNMLDNYKQALEDETGYPCGVVWEIDSALNFYCYDTLYQIMLTPNSNVNATKILYVDLPYDIGEQESERDIWRFYPNYEYPYKKKNIEVKE